MKFSKETNWAISLKPQILYLINGDYLLQHKYAFIFNIWNICGDLKVVAFPKWGFKMVRNEQLSNRQI